jgi:SOS-response transcriptional repressor LexA
MDSDLEGAERQQQLLDSIVDASELGHRMPTYDELATRHQMVKSGVYKIIRILINKDYLECERTPSGRIKACSMQPTMKALRWRDEVRAHNEPREELAEVFEIGSVPVFPEVEAVAGHDRREAANSYVESMNVPRQYVRPGVFVMKVTGESMSGDNLHTGDDVMVDENARWHDGDMVAVRDGGVTRIKRIWNDASRVVLESSNPDVTPICLERGKEHLADVIVHGKVVTTICSHIQPGRRSNRSSLV